MHLQIVGILLILLGLSHAFFNRFFGWEQELAEVSLLTRRVFFVHNFFIALGVVLGGAVTVFCATALLRPGILSRAVLAGMATFWLCRLLAQFAAYDSAIWRGNRFRTSMHVACSLLWCYVTATYGIACLALGPDRIEQSCARMRSPARGLPASEITPEPARDAAQSSTMGDLWLRSDRSPSRRRPSGYLLPEPGCVRSGSLHDFGPRGGRWHGPL